MTLTGPEFGPIQRDLKLIYKAGHTPDDVRAFMDALERSEEDWTPNWTIKTVRMKLSEFKAGKLFNGNGKRPSTATHFSKDDEERAASVFESCMRGAM